MEDIVDAGEPAEVNNVNNDETEAEDNIEEEVDIEEADIEEEAGVGDDAEYYASLEEAFAEPEVKTTIDQMLAPMQGDGMSLTYEVSENNFIMIFQFTDNSITFSDEITEALETEIEKQADVFKEQAGVFDEAVGQKGVCTVTVRYLDSENNVLFEGTYAAD